jgi:hypothetical protein
VREALEVDDEAVAAKWDEIAPRIDRMAERIGDPNDFPVQHGSSLSGDDKASSPYCVSHGVRMCLVRSRPPAHGEVLLTRLRCAARRVAHTASANSPSNAPEVSRKSPASGYGAGTAWPTRDQW